MRWRRVRQFLRGMAALLALCPTVARADAPQLSDFPFWATSAGWWGSENTYFDRDLDYNIRRYNSLVLVELDGRRYRETEYKFYPPGKSAQYYGRGQLGPDDGIETVTVFNGELRDEAGTVVLTSTLPAMPGTEATEFRVLGADTALRLTQAPGSGLESYRMVYTLPTPDRKYIANFGLFTGEPGAGSANAAPDARPGDLRGFALFRASRLAPADVDAARDGFRRRNHVVAVLEPGPDGTATLRRLGQP